MQFDEKIICRLKSGAVRATIWAAPSKETDDIAFRLTLIRQPEDMSDAFWNPLQFGSEDLPDLWKIAHEAQTTINQFDMEQVRAILEGREVVQ